MTLASLLRPFLAAAALSVALFTAPLADAQIAIVKGSFYTPNLYNDLTAAGLSVTEITSYTAASLSGFSAVIHYGNSYTDTAALESYVNSGGRLVLTPWSGLNYTLPSTISVFTNGGSPNYITPYPGVNVLTPDSLLSGVTFPPGTGGFNVGYISGISFDAGATQVAEWGNGIPFLGIRNYGAGEVVGINMHVITSDTAYQVIDQPWATQLLVNAVGAGSAVPEPSTYGLFAAAGLAVLTVVRRRKKA